jgi:hypothetical protein
VSVNSLIYLFITCKDSFSYKENKRQTYLEDFPYNILSFLLQDFLTLKKGCRRLLEEKNSTTLFLSFESINSTKQRKKIKHSRQHVPSMERGLKRAANTHYSYTSQTQLHKEINKLGFGADCFLELF